MKSEEVKGAARFVNTVVSEKEILEMRTSKLRNLRYKIIEKEEEILEVENGKYDKVLAHMIETCKCAGRNPLEQFTASVTSRELTKKYGEKYAKEVLVRINGAI